MAQDFISNSTVTYDVSSDGTTNITHDITLQNTTSGFYATSYSLSVAGINPINPQAFEGGQSLPVTVTNQSNNVVNIKVDFPDAVVGNGSKREFQISFLDKSLLSKDGEIWEFTAPKLEDPTSFDFYSTILKVPIVFGQVAYMSPNPTYRDSQDGKNIFTFDKSASVNTTITAAFGQFQVFSFNLTYHLENPLNQAATTEIALPPDTNYQKMIYSKIVPTPAKVSVDEDGNWIASFNLNPLQKVDVNAKGAVQLFANPIPYPKPNPLPSDLEPTDLWQTKNSQIMALAARLKTPKAIYDYVTSTLSYDFAKVSPDVARLGAVNALRAPTQAICTEFTDLFVAIARAANIPAREIEGYAYTENSQIQPLSLVADVLHAWPEYWDNARGVWVPVDPTWGSTSGIDYFSKLDLRHFAFVVHGIDPKKPYPAGSYKLGQNPQKDVNVMFGQLPLARASLPYVQTNVLSQLPFSNEIIDIKVHDSGPIALYNVDYKVLFGNKPANEINMSVIPPYGYYETKVVIPYSFLGQKTPADAIILLNGNTASEIPTYKTFLTVSNLLMLLLFVFLIVLLVYLKFRDVKNH